MAGTNPWEITHEPDGLIWGHSEVLGLDLCWREGELRFRDPSTGKFLPTPEEQQAARIEAEARAEQEHAARIEAETHAEQEHAARIEAEARVAALEAELRQLRGQ